MPRILVLLMAVFLATQAAAGTWTANQFIYKPTLGARGEAEKNTFDAGLDRMDAHLGKYKTLGDPGYSTISEALTTIGSTETTLAIPAGVVNITTNTTIPANVHFLVLKGGKFSIGDGVTLTINGSFQAGPYQVFTWTGSGKVAFGDGAIDWALPEWWGAKGDNSTDCSAALQAAFNAWWRVRLGKGTYLWNSTSPLYLNSTSAGQYMLQGTGKLVTALQFSNIAASAYCIKVNEDAGGNKVVSFPGNYRLVLTNMRVKGNSNYPHLIRVRESSVWLENLRLNDFADGVSAADYCDHMIVRFVEFWGGSPTGYLLRQGGNGDCWLVEGVHAGVTAHDKGIYYGGSGCNHTFRNIIGGYFVLNNPFNLTIEDWHCENTLGYVPLTVNGGSVTVRRSNWWNNRDAVPIVVNEADGYRRTDLVLEDCSFVSFFNTLQARGADIHLQAIGGQSSVELRNVSSFAQASGKWVLEHTRYGISITANDSNLNGVLSAIKNKRLLTNCRIHRRETTWRVESLDGLPRYHSLSNPNFGWIAAVSFFMSSLTAGTYYYKAALYYDDGIHTAASSEYSATVSTNGYSVGMTPSYKPAVVMRLWRGTQSGVYDRYVDIPLAKVEGSYFYDQGDHVCGFSWITSNVPTPPTANTTMEGIEHANGKREFWASAAPSSAEFTGVQGDRVWNTAPAAGGTPGWVCVTAGSPGTWKAMANLAN